MKNNQLFDLKTVFNEISSTPDYKGIEFAYFIIKNKKIVEQQTTLLEELLKDAKIQKFEEERIDLLTNFSKDESGNSVTRPAANNRIEYIIPEEKKSEFEKAIDELKTRYATEIEEYSKKVNEYNVLLDQEFVPDVQFARITKDKLPPNLSIKHLEALFDLID